MKVNTFIHDHGEYATTVNREIALREERKRWEKECMIMEARYSHTKALLVTNKLMTSTIEKIAYPSHSSAIVNLWQLEGLEHRHKVCLEQSFLVI